MLKFRRCSGVCNLVFCKQHLWVVSFFLVFHFIVSMLVVMICESVFNMYGNVIVIGAQSHLCMLLGLLSSCVKKYRIKRITSLVENCMAHTEAIAEGGSFELQ